MATSKPAVTGMDQFIAALVSNRDQKTLAIWAAECAERVLPHFEKAYPEDTRPRDAIEAARAWVRGEIKMLDARKAAIAAHAAARDVEPAEPAQSAARAAGHAAATAHVARHAIHAASYAAVAIHEADGSTKADLTAEREWQYRHLLSLGETEKG